MLPPFHDVSLAEVFDWLKSGASARLVDIRMPARLDTSVIQQPGSTVDQRQVSQWSLVDANDVTVPWLAAGHWL